MIGLEFICKEFDISFSDLAKRLGVSRSLVSLWISGDRKIPDKRIEQVSQLPDFIGIDKKYFSKELTNSEKLKIQAIQLEQSDKGEEIPFFDNEGNEVGTTMYYESQGLVRTLHQEIDRLESIEKLHSVIDHLVLNEPIRNEFRDTEEYQDKLGTFFNTANTLKRGTGEQQAVLNLLLDVLSLDRSEIDDDTFGFFGTEIVSRHVPRDKKYFAEDLLAVLFKHEIISHKVLKSYFEELKKDKED